MSLTDEQLADFERYLEHSLTLNTVAFRLAQALGDVPEGQEWAEGDPVELADRLIAERDKLRAEPRHPSVGDMYRDVYFAISRLMDEAHGPNEDDGAGQGLQEDVALVVAQRDQARVKLHIPTLAAASTPGVWNVYCVACSDAAQDYVQVCAAGRWQVPAQLVAYDLLVQARGDAVDAVQMVADLTSVSTSDSGSGS